nr:SMC5-SMC6 complex localization factor protein 2 isoform X2 [Anolis sagrei ordinatus]
MTQNLSNSAGEGGKGSDPDRSPLSTAGRHCRTAGREGKGGRNQCITDYFKLTVNQDRTVLCSSEKRNGESGFAAAHTAQLRQNICSPKQNRRKKFQPPPPNRSPIIEAFFRGAKSEQKDNPDNGVYVSTKTMHSNTVVRKLFVLNDSYGHSLILKDNTENPETQKIPIRTRSPLSENGRECKKDCVDLELIGSPKPKRRRKLLSSPSNRSPRIEVFFRGAKSEKRDNPDNGVSISTKPVQRNTVDTRDILRDTSSFSSQKSSSDESLATHVSKAVLCSKQTSDKIANREKREAEQTENNTSALSSKTTDQLVSSLESGNSVPLSESCPPVTTSGSSCDLHKLNIEASSLKAGAPSRKRSVSNSEEEISDRSLDSSDEEILLPLEKILSQSPTCEKSPERINDEDNTTGTLILSHSVTCSKPSVEINVSYLNRLLEEKEEFSRVEELERQLQQAKGNTEKNYPLEEQTYDDELLAKHREILDKYSIIDGIPDQHPGENIFQVAQAGKIFSQHNLDLRNFGFHPQNPIEKYMFSSGIAQQLFVITEGILVSAYHISPCPVPIQKWMFQMMLVHSDCSVSRKILQKLMDLTISNAHLGNEEPVIWIPSLFDIAVVLVNLGVPFNALFPLHDFQPSFTEDHIRSEMPATVTQQSEEDVFGDPVPFFFLVDVKLCNMARFLRLCISICRDGYTQKEIFILLLLLFKLSLEKEMKQFVLVDLQCLIIKLLENIDKWNTKMPELCLAISCLSSHHHNLLHLIQFVPNWTERGKEVRRHLSLVVLSKLLENHVNIPSSHDQQMSLLCKELVMMKPSTLVKKLLETSTDDNAELSNASFISKFESKAYYLLYVLLHLVREASNFESTNLSQKKWLLKLSSILEKNIKCDIRENARLFYKTKVKDVVARTYSKWQQMINSCQLIQGMIHDLVVPNAEQNTSKRQSE